MVYVYWLIVKWLDGLIVNRGTNSKPTIKQSDHQTIQKNTSTAIENTLLHPGNRQWTYQQSHGIVATPSIIRNHRYFFERSKLLAPARRTGEISKQWLKPLLYLHRGIRLLEDHEGLSSAQIEKRDPGTASRKI